MTAQTAGTGVIHQRHFKANGELSPGSLLISSNQIGSEASGCCTLLYFKCANVLIWHDYDLMGQNIHQVTLQWKQSAQIFENSLKKSQKGCISNMILKLDSERGLLYYSLWCKVQHKYTHPHILLSRNTYWKQKNTRCLQNADIWRNSTVSGQHLRPDSGCFDWVLLYIYVFVCTC